MAKIQRLTIPRADEDVQELERSHGAGGMPGFGQELGRFSEKFSTCLPHNPAASRLDIDPKEMKVSVPAEPSPQMFARLGLQQPGARSSPLSTQSSVQSKVR